MQGNTLRAYREHVLSEEERVVKKEHVVQNQLVINEIGEECIWHVHMQRNMLCIYREHVMSQKERVVKKRTRCPKPTRYHYDWLGMYMTCSYAREHTMCIQRTHSVSKGTCCQKKNTSKNNTLSLRLVRNVYDMFIFKGTRYVY